MTATLEDTRTFVESRARSAPERKIVALEVLAVLVSPVVLYYCLRLRGMAPPGLPDPAMHTTFILDPHDAFQRYEAIFAPSARLREAARAGFLVPARLSYVLFGAVPGFFVYRYLLALVAIVPAYLLLKRMYGRWAGFLAIAVIMSSPVVITAWGTDYPDSAAVSYLAGGLAALALWWQTGRARSAWLALAGILLTFAVWTHGIAMPLVTALLVAFVAVRVWSWRTDGRELAPLARDLALLGTCALVVTALLALGSGLLLGRYDFIGPTIQSARVLSRPSMLRADHSISWSWAPYVNYLLVPPAVALAFIVTFARRQVTIAPAKLFVWLAGSLQLAILAYLQFFGSLQTLEMHYFSSMLWSSVNLLLALTIAEIARPALGRLAAGIVPVVLVVAVVLAYEGAVNFGVSAPTMTWVPRGAILVVLVVAAAAVGRLVGRRALAGAASIVAIAGGLLVLTVAQSTRHGPLPDTVYDPTPKYADALDGSASRYISEYKVLSRLPGFVGHPAYKGEVLLTWAPRHQFGEIQGPLGIFHNAFTFVDLTFPVLDADGAQKIEHWRVGQVLLMSVTGQDFDRAERALGPFHPVVVRRGVFSNGRYHLHVWLVDLRSYIRATHA
ncbi:MAG: glycosyltransferase family 39 protein [Actinomycetota bacterium]|nr:glycosyltransferase family 39 protein [Actinomycetota bacterium]